MTESLSPNEREPLSPAQLVGLHIMTVVGDVPADPQTGLQVIKRFIDGNRRNTVLYERNPTTAECTISIDIAQPPKTRNKRISSPHGVEPPYHYAIHFTKDKQLIDITAATNLALSDPNFEKGMANLLISMEPALKKRPLSWLGKALIVLRGGPKGPLA